MEKARKNGDGTFRVKPNGRVEYIISCGYDIYGKRIRKSFSGKSEAECRRKAKEYEIQLVNQKTALSEATLSDWLDVWLKAYKSNKVQQSTYDEYKYIISIIKKHKIAKMELTQIKPLHINDFFCAQADYSNTIIKKLRFVLNAAFEAALDNDMCYKNPTKHAELPIKKQTEKEAYTEEEVAAIKTFAATDELFGLPMLLLVTTGIRSGELRALDKSQIHLAERYIDVCRAVKRDGTIGPPKNGKPRKVPIDTTAVALIAPLLASVDKKYICGNTDAPITAASLRSRYQHFFGRLNKTLSEGKQISQKPPHSTRHTYGTHLQRKGVPIAIVSAILGHQSTNVTDKYTHLSNIDDLKNAIDGISKNPPQNPPQR